MSMEKLMKEVEECVEREYGRAGAKFGLTNNSDHESYAVLLEEFQEAQVELKTVERQLELFWGHTKCNDNDHVKYRLLMQMTRNAIYGACEMIQVAAMAKKAAMTVCNRSAIKEFKGEEGESE